MSRKTSPSNHLRRLFLRRSVPYGLFALAYGLSIAAGWYVSSTVTASTERQARLEFLTDAQLARRQIQAGLDLYLEVVRAGAVLMAADTEINGAEFRRFVSGLQLRERYPGLEGVGFAQCVEREKLRPLLRSVNLDGTRVDVWPPPAMAVQCPTIFLEPRDSRNREAIGFDLASEPVLFEAMWRARDDRFPVASSKLSDALVWERGWRGNVVLFIPVYRMGRPLQTVDERRRALVGFVFAPFDAEQLLKNVGTSAGSTVAVDVYDGALAAEPHMLSRSDAPPRAGAYETVDHVRVAGRQWVLSMRSIGEPTTVAPMAAQQTLFVGVTLSFLLFLVTASQVRAWETAARHESELRASAEALRESEAQAQAANRAKDVFLATVSHELRTPLNVVLGWVNMLRSGTVREERRTEALAIIERNARHQAELIDDLLDVSRIVTGKLRLQLRPLLVAPVIDAVVQSLRPGADAKGVGLSVTSVAAPAVIRGDADRLHQIAWNLISNAVKFTPSGGRVSIELTGDAHHVVLSVRDTGIGIDAEFLPFVFDRFRQADSSPTRMHGGVGLGLAIVRDLVELHGGAIDAKSDGKDLGATFVATFPAAPANALPAAAPLRDAPPLPAKQLDGIRVLLVDDDAGTRDLLTEALLSTGARVMAADSARNALAQLSAEGADVIVSDIAMPDEDGYWLIHRVRALPGDLARTPAIALTALARSEDRARAIESGFQLHLAKPVPLGELQAGLAALVAQGHAGNPHGRSDARVEDLVTPS